MELKILIIQNGIPFDSDKREEYYKNLQYEINLEEDKIKYIEEVIKNQVS